MLFRSTNMAGRGTDIMLGGNAEFLAKSDLRKQGVGEEMIGEATGFAETDNQEILDARVAYAAAEAKYKAEIGIEADKVRAAGGLFIIGSERHESRRIDNQLRGRAGRQGDPGESRFFLSLEDDIMRLFGGDRVSGLMDALKVDEDTPIEQKMLSNMIESSQKRVESVNFQRRKSTLEYDDVMNTQRKILYGQRYRVLDGEDLQSIIRGMIPTVLGAAVQEAMNEQGGLNAEDWRRVTAQYRDLFHGMEELRYGDGELVQKSVPELVAELDERAQTVYTRREKEFGSELMREIERVIMLKAVDEFWMDHIDAMSELRKGIGLRGYAQEDPIVAYKREGFDMFEQMTAMIQQETVRRMFVVRVQGKGPERERVAKVTSESAGGDGTVKKQPVRKTAAQKVGRNDPCPCGSGKKYKKCCGANE